MPVKVLIVDDSPDICQHFAEVFSEFEHISLVGSAHSGAEGVELTALLRPDVVLMDIEMETEDAGILAASEILSENPDVKVITLTVYDDANKITDAYEAGVSAYILKSASDDEIIATISEVTSTDNTHNLIVKKLSTQVQKFHREQASFLYCINLVSKLSASELDVLIFLCEGKKYREIADIRRVSDGTIRVIVNKIIKKLNTHNIRDIIKSINDNNLVPLLKKVD